MILATFLLTSCLLALLTLLPLSRCEEWWVRSLDFPRLQLFLLWLLLLLLEFLWLDVSRGSTWGLVTVAGGGLVVQGWWIMPFTRLYPVEVKPAVTAEQRRMIRIMTANVLTTNRRAGVLIELVRENSPDILVTLESDGWWQARLDELEPSYPYTIKCPLDNLYGMHVYSRFVLEDSRIDYLMEPGIPSMHTLVRLPSGNGIRAHFLHPKPPSPAQSKESSKRDAELIMVARSVAETRAPVIVTGDLNDVAWSETTRLFKKISGLLDPRVGRGMFNTFNAGHWFMRWPLDHLFHSDHFTLSNIRRLPAFGSDHFPLFTELVYDIDRGSEQNSLEADADDVAWAKEKTDDEGVGKSDVPVPGKD
ncbi:MAG: endonuclease/exonuclease/phosphatase family protein [Desulfobacterales bacterium]